MKLIIALATLSFCLPACGGDSTPVDPNDVATEGGTITLAQCGYDLTTRIGASAPQLSSAHLGDDPAPKQVHLGLGQSDASTAIVMQWRTRDEATLATVVQYGLGSALDLTQDGFSFIFIGGFNQNGQTVRMHETHLCGLTPDTAYSYRVGGIGANGAEAWSETFSFRTAPVATADAEVVIANLGDSRDGFEVLGDLVALIDQDPPDLILFNGDAVTLGQVQDEWDIFFEVGESIFARAPLVLAHGNHEGHAINFYSQFAMPGDELNFSIDYGPVHITVLDDSPELESELAGSTADFLTADLAASADRPWSLLMHHRSLWSASTRHGSDERLQAAWGPIIDQYHVDLVLGGHDHNYERSKPMLGDVPQASAAEGTVYVVNGGAGAALYDNGSDFWTELSEKSHTALILRARPGLLEYEALRDDGSLLDSLMISK